MKKGFLHLNFYIALGVFVAALFILSGVGQRDNTISDRIFGTAQTAVLRVSQEGDEALIYLDRSAQLAASDATDDFNSRGGLLIDPEEGGYQCGMFIGYPYWNDKTKTCIPQFQENYLDVFKSKLAKELLQHPTLNFPNSYSFTLTPNNNGGTLLFGRSISPLEINFNGGGARGYSLGDQPTFVSDYVAATNPVTLDSAQRTNPIQFIVVHYTVTRSVSRTIAVLQDSGFSYHYLIDKDGSVVQLVPESRSAQHAGCSGEGCLLTNMNQKSIGISFINCGFDEQCQGVDKMCGTSNDGLCWEPYTTEQLASFTSLVADIAFRNSIGENGVITAEQLLSHSQIKSSKQDPGPLFEAEKNSLLSSINAQVTELRAQNQVLAQTQTPQGNTITGSAIRELTDSVRNRVESYSDIIEKEAKKNNLDPAILKAIITQESNGVPDIRSVDNDLGLMQIVPFYKKSGAMLNHNECVKACGFTPANSMEEVRLEEYYDPALNICCGAAFFKKQTLGGPVQKECSGITRTWSTPYESGLRRYNGVACNDYVDSAMNFYQIYGGSAAQFALSEEGEYIGSYTLALSFEEEVDLPLYQLGKLQSTIQDIIAKCTDDVINCTNQYMSAYNKDVEWLDLTRNCSEHYELPYAFLEQLTRCAEEGKPCSVDLRHMNPQENFTLSFNGKQVWKTQQRTQTLLGDYPYEVGLYESDGQLLRDILTFEFKVEAHHKQFFVKAGNTIIVPVTDMKKAVFQWTTYNLGLVYQPQVEDIRPALPQNTHFFCMEQQSHETMKFALRLIDRIPPGVTLYGHYNQSRGQYDIQWQPLTTYDDGTEIKDIVSYELYCDYENNGDLILDESTLSYAFLDEDYFFTPEKYQNPITFPLDVCGKKPFDNQRLVLLMVAKDNAGQFNASRSNNLYLNPSMTEDTMGPLPLEVLELPETLVWTSTP